MMMVMASFLRRTSELTHKSLRRDACRILFGEFFLRKKSLTAFPTTEDEFNADLRDTWELASDTAVLTLHPPPKLC
jgi:hypothetical protein